LTGYPLSQPDELQRSVTAARRSGVDVRALVVINPSNPTGAIMTAANIRQVRELLTNAVSLSLDLLS
jgi:aspartate/methionine/tyrosine aminotransferase